MDLQVMGKLEERGRRIFAMATLCDEVGGQMGTPLATSQQAYLCRRGSPAEMRLLSRSIAPPLTAAQT